MIQMQQMQCPCRCAGSDAYICGCRTAVQAFIIDTIHTLVEEKISPVLVRLATTGPQVSTILSFASLHLLLPISRLVIGWT